MALDLGRIENCGAGMGPSVMGAGDRRTTVPWDSQAWGKSPTFFVYLRKLLPPILNT